MTDPALVAVQLVVWNCYPDATSIPGTGWYGHVIYTGRGRPRRMLAVGRDEAHAWREAEAAVLARASACREAG